VIAEDRVEIKPTEEAKRVAGLVAEELRLVSVEPERVAASVVGGVGITCRRVLGSGATVEREAYVEILNRGPIVACLEEDGEEVSITKHDPKEVAEVAELVVLFFASLCDRESQ